MISFQSDYNNGMLPEILEALGKTNDDKTPGYGFDSYTEAAKEKIRKAVPDFITFLRHHIAHNDNQRVT